jgi:hypothetical protein
MIVRWIGDHTSIVSFMTQTVRVILEMTSFVVSVGFIARLDNPSKINLSFVWTAYSCLKRSLKSDQRYQSCSSSSISTTDESHSRARFRRELVKW